MLKVIDRPLALIILDGWGFSSSDGGNALAAAHTPYYDSICRKFPMTTLSASGPRVGLPANTPGGPEVGHLNIGTGRVIPSNAARIASAIKTGDYFENAVFEKALVNVKNKGSALHLIGLLSDSGINSSLESLFALLRMAKTHGVDKVFVHCILDGHDVLARTADVYVEALEIKMSEIGVGKIASLCGRFFAMDTGENWERTARAFTMLTLADGERVTDAKAAIRNSFRRGINEEFIAPMVVESNLASGAVHISDGDTAIIFNHRADGIRQLVRSMAETASGPKTELICMTDCGFDDSIAVAFPSEPNHGVFAHALKEHGVPLTRITESERLTHVTHFFDGGNALSIGGKNVKVQSPKRDSFEIGPELASFKIADGLRHELGIQSGVFFVNLPAADLVAETGNFVKTVEAVQFVDTCLGGVLERIYETNGIAVVTSSHGNCEEMSTARSGRAYPSTSMNGVPFHVIDPAAETVELMADGSLEDVAPTLLGILNVEKPHQMTGRDLRVRR